MNQPLRQNKCELWVAIAALFIFVGFGLPFIAADIGGRMHKLAANGVVAQATVNAKREEKWRENNYRGVPKRPRKRQTLNISFDRMANIRHQDFVAGKPIEPPADQLPITLDLIVGLDEYAKYSEGSKVAVTFLPDSASFDKDSLQLTETVVEQGGPGFIYALHAAAAAMLLLGLWAGHRGWKQDKENA